MQSISKEPKYEVRVHRKKRKLIIPLEPDDPEWESTQKKDTVNPHRKKRRKRKDSSVNRLEIDPGDPECERLQKEDNVNLHRKQRRKRKDSRFNQSDSDPDDPEYVTTRSEIHCMSESSDSEEPIQGNSSRMVEDSDDNYDAPVIRPLANYMEPQLNTGSNNVPTFRLCPRATHKLEEMLYAFPPGIGVPDEAIEEIPDKYDYWDHYNRSMADTNFTKEEVAQEVENKIDEICDYFDRFVSDDLTDEEEKKRKPRDFQTLFYPTPWDIEEYKYYDLRPLLKIRTHRLRRTADLDIECTKWQYLTPATEMDFGLYMARGLEERSPYQVIAELRRMTPHLYGGQLDVSREPVTARKIARMEYLLQQYGNSWPVMEAVLGRYHSYTFISRFQRHIWLKNIKLRIGPWTEAEKERLKFGLFSVLDINSMDEVLDKRISCGELIPYVRTRSKFCILVFLRKWFHTGFLNEEFTYAHKIQLIDLLYSSSDYESVSDIQWEELAEHFPDFDKFTVRKGFLDMYYKIPYSIRKSFEDTRMHMHNHLRITYENLHRLQESAERVLKTNKSRDKSIHEVIQIKDEPIWGNLDSDEEMWSGAEDEDQLNDFMYDDL